MEKFEKRITIDKTSRETAWLNRGTEKYSSSRLRLMHYAEVECLQGSNAFRMHPHKYWVFHLIQSGKRRFIFPGKPVIELGPEDMYIFNPAQEKAIPGKEHVTNRTAVPVMRYYFAMERNIYAEQMFHLDELEILHLTDPEAVFSCVKEIGEMVRREEGCSEQELSILLFRFLTMITNEKKENSGCPDSYEQIMEDVRQFPQNYPTQRSLENAFRVSGGTLRKIFRRITGMTPVDYVVYRKLNNTRWMLENTELHIREIAALNGYADPAFYSKAFTKTFGMSPNQYRKENRKKD